jgi:hypothetical protein
MDLLVEGNHPTASLPQQVARIADDAAQAGGRSVELIQ